MPWSLFPFGWPNAFETDWGLQRRWLKVNICIGAIAFFSVLFLFPIAKAQSQVTPLYAAHAHNDYNRQNPLIDAISLGFTRIEVDVLRIDDELFVGHDMPGEGVALPTLRELYLSPLDSVLRFNGGKVIAESTQPFYLMIDIKTKAQPTYQLLMDQLEPFAYWIRAAGTRASNSEADGVSIILSGNRPIKEVIMNPNALVALDGRPSDLGAGYSTSQMPVVSQSYRRYSNWNGMGDMPLPDQARIRELALKVHEEGKLLRLWAHPEDEKVWDTLLTLGVDIINTDYLERLREFLLKRTER